MFLQRCLSLFTAFLRNPSGSATIYFVVTFPILLLIGGLATDAVLLNSQKRHVQSLADLAAQSGARHLPDAVKVRTVVQSAVNVNSRLGPIALSTADIQFGHYRNNGQFEPLANQITPTGATAIKVTVPTQFSAMLLDSVIPKNSVNVNRSAFAAQTGIVVFTLRNRLLSVNTRQALLAPVFNGLGLGLDTDVLSYAGLANARVSLQRLLGLVSTNISADALTFNDVLRVPVSFPRLLEGLTTQGALGSQAITSKTRQLPNTQLSPIFNVSPMLLNLRLGDILPNVTVSAFDLLSAFAGLAASPNGRLNVAAGLDLSPLASVNVNLGLIRPPVTVVAHSLDNPPLIGTVSQASVALSANILDALAAPLLRLVANVQVGVAEAQLKSLTCSAIGTASTLANFDVKTGPASIALAIGVFDERAERPPQSLSPTVIDGNSTTIAVRGNQLRTPIPIPHPLSLSGAIKGIGDLLKSQQNDMQSQINSRACEAGILSIITCPLGIIVNLALSALFGIFNTIIAAVGWVLAVLGVDNILQAILNLLGIGVAQADLIVDHVGCSARLMR